MRTAISGNYGYQRCTHTHRDATVCCWLWRCYWYSHIATRWLKPRMLCLILRYYSFKPTTRLHYTRMSTTAIDNLIRPPATAVKSPLHYVRKKSDNPKPVPNYVKFYTQKAIFIAVVHVKVYRNISFYLRDSIFLQNAVTNQLLTWLTYGICWYHDGDKQTK